MSWYDQNYLQRAPVSLDLPVAVGGAGSTVNCDLTISVPQDLPTFWENIRSDGFDAILVNNQNSLLTFKRNTFNFGNRQLVLEVDNFAYSNYESVGMCWLYWNYSSATDLAGSFTASSPRNGVIFLGTPMNRVVRPDRNLGNSSNSPSAIFTKTNADKTYIWFEIGSLLNRRSTPYQEKMNLENIDYILPYTINAAGSDEGNLTKNETVIVNGYIGILFIGGTANATYLAGCKVKTTLNQEFNLNCWLQIKEKLPPS